MSIDRVVDIADNGQHLSLHRGFLLVSRDHEEVGRVPLDDISALIVHGHGTTLSANLIAALAERSVFGVLCGRNHQPVACLWPLSGHHAQGARMRAQLTAALPLKKRLWKQLIQAKIRAQAAVLAAAGHSPEALEHMARRVRTGDPENIEAQAARRYWARLMGGEFRRDRDKPGTNALLNYGYAVMRAACARAIVASGLHPTIAVHHSAGHNDFALADDLIEPFRPYVDMAVRNMAASGMMDVDSQVKARLAGLLAEDLHLPHGVSPVAVAIRRAAHSLAMAFMGNAAQLDLPASPPPVQLAALGRA
ncbi:type II CRISPR-associated endonuclease Cas1 [Pacificimonas sp. WHA3]|uniref:CRISPR-associated endonuclease Cas1 n=1 Tax=Pacificimonas pallii TaxID=2827236 RepID=A0ABS6SGK3_9SPHN|nr:type II CRISPR-associated endonuclease Cas1 [Pacificimonas pallii]MBV7257481.1 type II CRISPR-associated endonuclease Cas1 [Pacificimonas pallii]